MYNSPFVRFMFSGALVPPSAGARRLRLDFVQTTPTRHLFWHIGKPFSLVEGLNNKAKLTTRKAYGYSSFKTLEIALYHTLGDLPEPKFTHRFF